MVYRPDFYKEQNIIGYTEMVGMKISSVYFFDRGQNSFGRITCHHEYAYNIGRDPVAIDRDYLIFNAKEPNPILQSSRNLGPPPIKHSQEYLNKIIAECMDCDSNCLIEFYCSQNQHIARSSFIQISRATKNIQTILFEIIKKHLYLKSVFWELANLERDYTDCSEMPPLKFKIKHWDKYYR